MNRAFKLTIFIHTNLAVGAGEEKAILNYAKYSSNLDVEMVIVQTDYCPVKNFSDSEIADLAGKTPIFTVKSPETSFRFESIYNSDSHLSVVRYIARLGFIFVKLFLFPPYSLVRNRKVLNLIPESDATIFYDVEFSGLLLGSRTKIRIGTLRRLFSPEKDLKNALLRIVYFYITRKMDALHYLNTILMKNSIIHKKFDFVQESGVDTDQFKPTSPPNGNLKFLFVSRLEAIKGTQIVIEAFKLIERGNIDLYVVGSGSLSDSVKKECEANSKIHYVGYQSGKALADIYRMCDVFVFPTLQPEQHPLVIKEALASGMYVICSSSLKGIFDDFNSKSYLSYVDPDVKLVAEAMSSALEDLEKIRRQRFEISRSAEIYDWKNITARLFQKIIEIQKKMQ